jgi:membrane fusion protein, multidrug efflux system
MKAIKFLVLITVAIGLAVSCSSKKEEAPQSRGGMGSGGGGRQGMRGGPLQVTAYIVKSKSLAESIEVPGTILPNEETEIKPEISGRIVRLNVVEGGIVNRGVVLIKLFDGDLQAQLNKLKVQLEIAKQTLSRQKELLKINGISQQEVDLSELQVNNIKADIELVQVNISKTEIKAPYTGKLGLRNVSLGAYVSPTTLISTIRQVNQLKLDFNVPEKYGSAFAKGRKVNFTVAGSDLVFTASVLATETAVQASTRSLKVRSVISGSHPALLPGAFAKVALNMGGDRKSLVVPTQAIIPQARNKQVIIYASGNPEFRVVETGIRDSSLIQIVSGLKEGDTILMTGLLAIRPDSKLKLTGIR